MSTLQQTIAFIGYHNGINTLFVARYKEQLQQSNSEWFVLDESGELINIEQALLNFAGSLDLKNTENFHSQLKFPTSSTQVFEDAITRTFTGDSKSDLLSVEQTESINTVVAFDAFNKAFRACGL